MPELKNEIPTDSELREYFLEDFAFTVEGEMYAPPNRGVPELTGGCNRLIKKAGEAIFASLQRLNRLERTDPFWRGTNRRPTVYKLREFCDVVLKENAGDVLALWTQLALDVLWGTSNGRFDLEQLRQLRAAGKLEAEELICAELHIEFNWGRSTASTTARLLRELGLSDEARPVLETGRRSADGGIVNWCESVLANLSKA
jgi:hypothetical protein